MASPYRVKTLAVILLVLSTTPLSAQRKEYPLTQTGQSLAALSEFKGSAPPVAQNVTFDRLIHARSEPQNWLTYYGAYDAQRYSSLNQITVNNVKNQMAVKPFLRARPIIVSLL